MKPPLGAGSLLPEEVWQAVRLQTISKPYSAVASGTCSRKTSACWLGSRSSSRKANGDDSPTGQRRSVPRR